MRGIKHLSIEAGPRCQFSREHDWCPSGTMTRYGPRAMTGIDAALVVKEALALGFDGWVGFHYYNEPTLYPEFITAVMSRVPEAHYVLWTNGLLLRSGEFDAGGFDWIVITDYTDEGPYPGADVYPPTPDGRIHNYAGHVRETAGCKRIDVEVAIDHMGGVHLCCEDWAQTYGNVLLEPLSEIMARREPIAAELRAGTCERGVCLSCRNPLTVAISTHAGYRDYLPKCVVSACEYADEVFVFDDGDGCADVVLPSKAVYRSLPKTGNLIQARRAGITSASGDYLLHLDADDWLLARPELAGDMCYSDLIIDGYAVWRGPATPDGLMVSMRSWAGTTVRGRNPLPAKPCYRVAWLREHGLSWYAWPSTTYAEDVRTLIEYLRHDPTLVRTETPYYAYRVHGAQSVTGEEEFLRDFDAYFAATRHERLEP